MLPDLLTFDGCVSSLTWPGAVDALRQGHRLPRPEQGDILLGTGGGKLLNRAARIEGLGFAIKGDSIFPGNVNHGMPSIQGAVLLFSGETGAVRAVIESRLITQYKTAADSVLGALCLARADSSHLLIVGAGVVAATLAQAYVAAFPGISTISFWARRHEQAQLLAQRFSTLAANVSAVENLSDALAKADIVSSATMATEPFLFGIDVRAGTHVDLVGSYTPDMCEADAALVAKAVAYVDFVDTVVDRVGEFVRPMQTGLIGRDHVRGDLYDLVRRGGSSRESAEQVTLFKNGGGAHLDLMMADYVVRAVGVSRNQ